MIVGSPPAKTDHDWVEKRNRCYADRRSGLERRVFYRIDYFMDGGQERRSGVDRRSGIERRRSWTKNGMPCINPSSG
ncbi:MAG: hypothetical protein QNI97_17215 [Desulfobacterales bacterium]|nr:hypothetical protein [Desulfobacterales bacterium]